MKYKYFIIPFRFVSFPVSIPVIISCPLTTVTSECGDHLIIYERGYEHERCYETLVYRDNIWMAHQKEFIEVIGYVTSSFAVR